MPLSALLLTAAFVVAAFKVAEISAAAAGKAAWDYKDFKTWGDACNANTKQRQSPIHLTSDDAVSQYQKLQVDDPLRLSYYGGATTGHLVNNGHSVVWKPVAHVNRPRMSGSGFGEGVDYVFDSMHFHWADSDCEGSEHVVHYRPSPLEVHFVHYNTKYDSLGEAVHHADGLAVVGLLFRTSNSLSSSSEVVGEYNKIAEKISDVVKPHANASLSLDLSALLLKAVNILNGDTGSVSTTYFRYPGSLTTPPCSEAVTWTVIERPIIVSPQLVEAFRKIEHVTIDGKTEPLLANFRPIQPRYGRSILTNALPSARRNSATADKLATSSGVNLLFVVLLMQIVVYSSSFSAK